MKVYPYPISKTIYLFRRYSTEKKLSSSGEAGGA